MFTRKISNFVAGEKRCFACGGGRVGRIGTQARRECHCMADSSLGRPRRTLSRPGVTPERQSWGCIGIGCRIALFLSDY